MRRAILLVLSILLTVVSFTACKAEEASLPEGVCGKDGKNFYRIMLPSSKKVDDFFDLTGNKNTMVVSDLSQPDSSHIAVYYKSVANGGWVAYTENETGLILYFSNQFSNEEVRSACVYLTMGKDDYMSWDAAQQYIP